jgi:hypothetical protein|tara:strand:- start:571 stop:999 length:429 start_codon:yes stop_codon:yes gene_type:complete
MSDISIEEFYNNNKCNIFFDEQYYLEQHPETEPFYKEHCQGNNIDNKSRLYFHWVEHGLDMGFAPHKEDIYHMAAFALEEINSNYKHKDRLKKMFFNIIKSTEQDPHICADNNKKQYDIDILKYVIDNIPIKDRLQKDSFDD